MHVKRSVAFHISVFASDQATAEHILYITEPKELLPLLKWRGQNRLNWEKIDDLFMVALMWVKFSNDLYLKERLLMTGVRRLVEDTFDPRWG